MFDKRRKESEFKKKHSPFLCLNILLRSSHVGWCLKFDGFFLTDITEEDKKMRDVFEYIIT